MNTKKIPEMRLGKEASDDSVFLKKNGVINAIITYNLNEILLLIEKGKGAK